MAKVPRVPKIHRHKSGQARVRIGGKDHYLGVFGSEEAEQKYRELVGTHLLGQMSTADMNPKRRQSFVTVEELLAAYLAHAKSYYRDASGKNTGELAAMQDVMRFLRAELPNGFLCVDFGPLRLKQVRETLVAKGNSRPYINKTIQRLVRIFRFGVENELVPPDIYHGLRAVPGLKRGRTDAPETAPIQPVPLGDVTAAVQKMSPRIRAMVELQLATAMRPGEVCIIRPCDVNTSGDVWLYEPRTHKTAYRGHDRIVRIGPKGQRILEPWLKDRDPETHCFSPTEAREDRYAAMREKRKSKVQPSQRDGRRKADAERLPGKHYTVESYGRAVARACADAGVEKFSPNRLRHTAATIIRRDFGLEAAQVILGHKHAAVTQVYAERDAALAERVAAEIG